MVEEAANPPVTSIRKHIIASLSSQFVPGYELNDVFAMDLDGVDEGNLTFPVTKKKGKLGAAEDYGVDIPVVQ